MKSLIRQLFSAVLSPLESGNEPFAYKPSHRIILVIMSTLFIGLATTVAFLIPEGQVGYYLPVILFGGAGLLGIIVGTVGSDRAVAKLWGSR